MKRTFLVLLLSIFISSASLSKEVVPGHHFFDVSPLGPATALTTAPVLDDDIQLWVPENFGAARVFEVPAGVLAGLKSGSQCTWKIIDADPFSQFQTIANGSTYWAFLVYTGKSGHDIRLDRYPSVGAPDSFILRVVGDNPDPPGPDPPGPDPPGPDPNLTGLAKQVYDAAMQVPKLDRGAEAPKLASVFNTVAAGIRDGRWKTTTEVYNGYRDLILKFKVHKNFKAVETLLHTGLNKQTTLDGIRKVFEDAALGVETAGRATTR